jgi:hydroxyacylglutathione hydrolase
MILVKSFYAHNELRNYSYLILDKDTGHSWVIDPYEASPIIDYIRKNGLVLKGILNTHQHFDHIRGNGALHETFQAPIKRLNDSETLKLNSTFTLETMNTPGHTMDHQVFIWKEQDRPLALFSGDTLFNSGVGNCRGGGDVNDLYRTTKRLMESLPESTLLYPGHDYRKRNLEFAQKIEPENKVISERLREVSQSETFSLHATTLKEEFKVNPFFRLDSTEVRDHVKHMDEKEVFIELRKLRDQW